MTEVISDHVGHHSLNHESQQALGLLEKCGEIFLERPLGSLVFLCSFCDGRFEDIDVFSNHMSETHIAVESVISYEPDEVEENINPAEIEESCIEYPMEYSIVKEEQQLDDTDFQHDLEEEENSQMSTNELVNILESPKTVLDIQVYYDELQSNSDVKDESNEFTSIPDMEPEQPTQIEADTENTDNLTDQEILRSKLNCKFCGEQFEYVKNLRQHNCGMNKGRKVYHCTICAKIFKKKSGMEVHMMMHKGVKPHSCDLCKASFACKQNLIVHIRRHTGEKPFKCDFCDKRFASSTEKISHMRTHTGERPYICEICGKAHASSSQLTEHMMRHLDIRNYSCGKCDKRFRNSYNLRMHQLTHEDAPRKFSCEHCMAAFKTQNNLMQHLKIHKKEKEYVCKICDRSFAQHPGLYSHMKSHAISK